VICALLPVVAAGAQVYRCSDPSGVPRFQSGPCADGGEALQLGEPAARWEPLRPGERRLWEQTRRSEMRRRAPATKPRAGPERASQRSCWQKRQRLDAVAAKLRRGYKPAQGERLRRRRDELQGFIARYCE
jgi:hypothetical protein